MLTITQLSRTIIASNGFIEPGAAGYGRSMGQLPSVPSAVLLALVSPTSDQGKKVADASKGTAPGRASAVSKPSALAAFLLMTPEEKFDLEAINSIDLPALVVEARGDKRVLREVFRTAQALLPRVRAETEDPLLVSAILRKKTLDWYRRSPTDPNWAEYMPLRLGGIFYESRVPGGRLSRKLSVRLTLLINECVQASGTMAFLRAGVNGLFRGSAMVASMMQFALGSKRPRLTQQVAQAYLDDLAACGRNGGESLPLERLSDLGRRTGSQEVNMTVGGALSPGRRRNPHGPRSTLPPGDERLGDPGGGSEDLGRRRDVRPGPGSGPLAEGPRWPRERGDRGRFRLPVGAARDLEERLARRAQIP